MVSTAAIKLENHHQDDCFFFGEPIPFGTWEQQLAYTEGYNLVLPSLLEFEPFPLMGTITPHDDLNDVGEISGDFGLWDFDHPSFDNHVSITNPNSDMINMHKNHVLMMSQNNNVDSNDHTKITYSSSSRTTMTDTANMDFKRNGRHKSSGLKLEEIQKYFDVPITVAARELNVGLTVLKKRCRELNITRWPHRKIKSLKSLIHNVKELGMTNEIEMLEEHKRMVEKIPEMELTERTKKLRQACFKANYKKRRSLYP
ncbi:UNVERIFIED_CONTAM: protein RKD4 [Sesamum latifolium]|uniref:Protein RKD4 n=1 Tax=Sesamum latifolium TaxID=2727402 RepID=A0AAW2XFM6_9LAMI